MPPVPAALDEDLFCIQVGKELGVPATEVEYLPEYWIGAVRTMWAWRELEEKRRSKRSNRGAKSTSTPAANRGRTRGG